MRKQKIGDKCKWCDKRIKDDGSDYWWAHTPLICKGINWWLNVKKNERRKKNGKNKNYKT